MWLREPVLKPSLGAILKVLMARELPRFIHKDLDKTSVRQVDQTQNNNAA